MTIAELRKAIIAIIGNGTVDKIDRLIKLCLDYASPPPPAKIRNFKGVNFVKAYIKKHGYAPTYTEIMKGLKLKSRQHAYEITKSVRNLMRRRA
jgi:hypothetical protein